MRLNPKELETIRSLEEKLFRTFKISFNLEKLILSALRARRRQLKIFLLVLRVTRPRAAFIVGSGGKESFVEACQKLKITCYEIQHGVMSSIHPDYNFSNKQSSKRVVPDGLLLFGNAWRQGLSLVQDPEKIVEWGFAFFEEKKRLNLQEARFRHSFKVGVLIPRSSAILPSDRLPLSSAFGTAVRLNSSVYIS